MGSILLYNPQKSDKAFPLFSKSRFIFLPAGHKAAVLYADYTAAIVSFYKFLFIRELLQNCFICFKCLIHFFRHGISPIVNFYFFIQFKRPIFNFIKFMCFHYVAISIVLKKRPTV